MIPDSLTGRFSGMLALLRGENGGSATPIAPAPRTPAQENVTPA